MKLLWIIILVIMVAVKLLFKQCLKITGIVSNIQFSKRVYKLSSKSSLALKPLSSIKMIFQHFFLFCFVSPFYSYLFVFLFVQQQPSLIQGQTEFNAGEAFDHAHEEGDEHVVNKEVCSKEDLPEEIIDSFDRCTNFIPVYQKLDLLRRCRDKVFKDTHSTKNEIRKEICFNKTAEHLFNECMTQIKETEGSTIPPPNLLQTMDFLFCMKTIALQRMKSVVSVSTKDGCTSGALMSTNNAAVTESQSAIN